MTYKLIALSFLLTTPIVAHMICRILHLHHFRIATPDIAWPIFAIQIVLLSNLFFEHNFLPHYLLMMSLLSLFVSIGNLIKSKTFIYKRFFKLFWRLSFIATVLFYLATVLVIFINK